MKVLENIRKISSIELMEEYINSIFNSSIDEKYIPAIINEGTFTMESGEDFYLKLVLAHHKVKYKKPWLVKNLTFGISDPDFDNEELTYDLFVENVITLRKVKGNSLYQLNPNIASDSIEEYEYNNNEIVNAYYNDEYSRGKGKPVLKYKDKNLQVIKEVLFPFLNDADSNVYPKYKLVAEYEYRTHNNHFHGLQSSLYQTNRGIHDVLIDDKGLRIIGSLDISMQRKERSYKVRDIKIIDLGTSKARKHNPENFNDDLDAGFVIFKKDVISILREKYYFYDLMIYDKTDIENYYLIDVLSDKVVFWEGEYNKLPETAKNLIDGFNYIPSEVKNLVSPGMMAWQLDSDWNYNKKMYPEQLLAWKVRESHFNFAIEIGITFLIPDNIFEFRDFMKKIEQITSINLHRYNQNHHDVQLLVKIERGDNVTLEKDELELLFRKYCYQIYAVMNDE